MKHITKKIIALLASAVTAVTTLSASYSSVFAETQQEPTASTEDSSNEFETGGFLGELMQDEFQSLAEEKEEEKSSDFAIYKLSYDQEIECVKVDYHAVKDCTLFVGFYNDEGTELITSITKKIQAGSKEYAEIYVSEALPDTYLIKAFMVDTGFLNPLSKSYVYNRCTRQMKETLSKTTEDFNADRVVKIDENNFIVLQDDVKIITPTETTDVFIEEDEDGNCIFENAVEISELKEGDKVFVNAEPKVTAFVVDSIKTDEDRVIVVRKKAQLGELIRYIKINSESSNSIDDIPIQKSETEGITREKLPQPLTGNTNSENPYSLQFPTIKSEANWAVGNIYYDHTNELSKTTGSFVKAGSLRLIVEGPFEICYDWDNKEILSVSMDITYTVELNVSAGVELFEPSIRILIFGSGALNIYVCPKLTVTLKGEGVVSYQKSFYLNFDSGYDSGDDSGYELTFEISEPTIIKLEGKISIEISLSLTFEFDITAITLLKIGPAEVWTIEVEKDFISNDPENDYIRHDCEDCFDINITRATQFNLTLCLEFIGQKWLGVEHTFTTSGPEVPVASFHRKNGITYCDKCDNKSHKVILNVYEKGDTESLKGEPAKNAMLFVFDRYNRSVPIKDDEGKEVKTNDEGQAVVWIKDKLLTDKNCVISARDSSGNTGRVSAGELFDNQLKGPNSFDIILNNEEPVAEYPKTGDCGIDMINTELCVWDKTQYNSYYFESKYSRYIYHDTPKLYYELHLGSLIDSVKYSLDENGELRFDGNGFFDYSFIHSLSTNDNVKSIKIGPGVLASCSKSEKDTLEDWTIGMLLRDFKFKKEGYTGKSTGVELYFEGNNGDAIVDYFAEKNTALSKVSLSAFKTIGSHAFSKCINLSEIHMPSSIEEIGEYAFSETKLDKFECPSKLEKIGQFAFSQCKNLKKVDINIGLKEIGAGAFESSNIRTVKLPSSVNIIGYDAFNDTPLKRIYICNKSCELRSYCLPNNTTVYGYMNSTAHKYVLDHASQNLKFVPFDPETPFTLTTTTTQKVATTTTTTTTVTTTSAPKSTAVAATNVAPDSECVFIAVKDEDTAGLSSDKLFEEGNVKFFDQHTADPDGSVSFSYLPDETEKWAFIFVSEAINDTITKAFGTSDSLQTTEYYMGNGVKGDANGDGQLDMSDVVLIMQALANPNKYGVNGTAPSHITARGFKYADTDGGGLTVNDALRIQMYLLEYLTSLD